MEHLATRVVDARQNDTTATSKPSTRSVYNSAGNRVAVIDTLNNITVTTYDRLGRVVGEEQLADSKSRSWTYNGLTTTYTDRDGRITRTTVDPESLERSCFWRLFVHRDRLTKVVLTILVRITELQLGFVSVGGIKREPR